MIAQGRGIFEFGPVPEPFAVAFAVVTQLADAWFVVALLSLAYWLGPGRVEGMSRRGVLAVIALVLAGFAVTIGLKTFFALPRPPSAEVTAPAWLPAPFGSAYVDASTATGYGFPSGHSVGATVVYVGLATFLDVWNRRTRAALAAIAVVLVGVSRIALGVHYVVDVIAGVAIGLALVWAVARLVDGVGDDERPEPGPAFLFAAALSTVALAAVFELEADRIGDVALVVGSSVGGLAGWHFVEGRVERTRVVGVSAALVAFLVVGSLWLFAYAGAEVLPLTASAGLSALALFVVVALPLGGSGLKNAVTASAPTNRP